MNFLTDSLRIRYDEGLKSIVIEHSDSEQFPMSLVRIREETYAEMGFAELAEFLGSRLLLLMPSMRSHFDKDIERMKSNE